MLADSSANVKKMVLQDLSGDDDSDLPLVFGFQAITAARTRNPEAGTQPEKVAKDNVKVLQDLSDDDDDHLPISTRLQSHPITAKRISSLAADTQTENLDNVNIDWSDDDYLPISEGRRSHLAAAKKSSTVKADAEKQLKIWVKVQKIRLRELII